MDLPTSGVAAGSGGSGNGVGGGAGTGGQLAGSGAGGAASTTGSGTAVGGAGGAGTGGGAAGSSVTAGAGGVGTGGAAGSSVTAGAGGVGTGGGAAGSSATAGAGGNGGPGGSSGAGGAAGAGGCAPTGVEVCDGLDNDCSGTPDDGNVCGVGCLGGTYGGHAYAFCDGPLNWQQAAADCATKSMKLVRIDDALEQAWVRDMAFRVVGTTINQFAAWRWLGANEIAVAGQWRWPDGTQFWQGNQNGSPVGGLYSNWTNGQPGSSQQDACAMMQNQTSAVWNGEPCMDLQPYVCELY